MPFAVRSFNLKSSMYTRDDDDDDDNEIVAGKGLIRRTNKTRRSSLRANSREANLYYLAELIRLYACCQSTRTSSLLFKA